MQQEHVNIPEERLVDQARRGDDPSRKALFVRYRDVALRVACRITSQEADAMDVVQDSFIKAFSSLDKLEDDSRFKAWLLRIVNNKALDLLRSRKVRKAVSIESDDEDRAGFEIADESHDPAGDDLDASDTKSRVHAAVDALPPDQRAVMALYLTGSVTYGEIAETLGVPMGTVMSRIYRARQQLMKWLPDLLPDAAKGLG